MKIKGKRITITKLELEDVYQMRSWGFHENPLIEDYNFPPMDDEEIKIWYRKKTNTISNKYYSVKDKEGKLIGYMGIKEIKRLRRQSTLGIVMDPSNVDKGYGTESLETFLNFYFGEMKMRSMLLEVAEFNKRAYRVYEKMGFKSIGYYLDEFFDSRLDLSNSYYLKEESSFVIKGKKIYNYIYKMKLDRKDYIISR